MALTSRRRATVFLTGSSGLVGAAFRRRLAADDWHVVALSRGDLISNRDSSRPAIVVHSAWPAADASLWAPFRDWSLRLRKSAADRGAWFVGIGSGVEAHADHPDLKEPYKSYARRKHELREGLAELDPERFAWIRLHFMFGPGERVSRLVPDAIRAALAGETFVSGSLERRRRWLHTDDQAAYFAEFLETPLAGNWDIAGRQNVSFGDMLALIERATGRELRLRESDDPAPDSAISLIKPERMAPVVPANAGNLDSLLSRLRDYAAELADQSTKG
jgi:nucleoside-diphosphate-sugar epimerase